MPHNRILDSRTRLACLVVLSVAHTLAHGSFVAVLLLVTVVGILMFPESFRKGLVTILVTAGLIALLSLMVLLLGYAQSPEVLLWDFLRWTSLVALTVTLTLSLEVFEFVTALRFFRLPTPIALAFGVGLRFLPILGEELRRILYVQRQAGFVFSRVNIGKFGFTGVLERKISPLFAAILRRIDSLTISVGAQELEYRISAFEYPPLRWIDFVALLSVAALCVAAGLLR